MEKFVLIAAPRSGTTFFEQVLSSHPRIHCYPEVFYSGDVPAKWSFYRYWLNKIQENEINITYLNMLNILDQYFDYIFNSIEGQEAIGIDIKYNQHNVVPNQMGILKNKKPKVIHLVRKNILKTLISRELNGMAMTGDIRRKSHGTEAVQQVKITFGLDDRILTELSKLNSMICDYRKMLKSNFACLEIYYEDLFCDINVNNTTISQTVLDQVYLFLNISDKRYDLFTDLRKTNSNKLPDLIENYNDVRIFLEQNGWGYLFEEKVPIPGQPKVGEADLVREGETFLKQGDLVGALQTFKVAYQANPHDKTVVKHIGSILTGLGKSEDAGKVYHRYLQKFPDDPEIFGLYRKLPA